MSDRGVNGAAIVVEGLTKHYKEVRAVQDLRLRIRPGEVYCFLGRNGAGKTTTIRMMLGLIRPTAGSVRLMGRDLRKEREAALSSTGYLVEAATAYPNLTVRENLDMQRRLRGAPASAVDEVIASQHLQEYAERRAGRLSLGNRQRLSLARALLGSPRILVLDEPANGLDPAGIVEIRELLKGLAHEMGVTVFLSSHILGEIAHLADRIGIIHQGRLVEEISGEELAASRSSGVQITVSDRSRAARALAESLGVTARAETAPGDLFIGDRNVRPEDVARAVVNAGVSLLRLCPVSENLEARFMRLTGEAS